MHHLKNVGIICNDERTAPAATVSLQLLKIQFSFVVRIQFEVTVDPVGELVGYSSDAGEGDECTWIEFP